MSILEGKGFFFFSNLEWRFWEAKRISQGQKAECVAGMGGIYSSCLFLAQGETVGADCQRAPILALFPTTSAVHEYLPPRPTTQSTQVTQLTDRFQNLSVKKPKLGQGLWPGTEAEKDYGDRSG